MVFVIANAVLPADQVEPPRWSPEASEFTSPILNTATLPGIGKVSLPLVWLVFIGVVSAVYATWVARHQRS